MLMRDLLKDQLIKLFEKEDWQAQFTDFFPASKIDILWITSDFVKEGKYLPEAMWIAEYLVNDPDPNIEDRSNQEILKGEESLGIVTVRGSLAWLINNILARLDTTYYPRCINLLEKLATDKVVYVRLQATYPLAGLAQNIRAEKDREGKEWGFTKEDKERTMKLIFSMLEANRQYPRVMEGLTNVFEKLRFISEEQAMYVLRSFLYEKGETFYPDYVTHNIAPVLIFFAEFRNVHTPEFKNAAFQELLRKVIVSAPSRLKTTLVWHFWKTIENDPKTYPCLKSYIPLFFQGDFQEEPLGQYEFLIEKILPQSPADAVEFFKLEIEYLKRALARQLERDDWTIWFHHPEDIIDAVAQEDPNSLPEILTVLRNISLKRGYVGDLSKIFSSYKKASPELQDQLSQEIVPMYESLRFHNPNLPPL
jgi:hypothetical protein